MKICFFSTKKFDQSQFDPTRHAGHHEISFLEPRLTAHTASLAAGHDAVCAFANDCLDAEVLKLLSESGIRLIALRSAGFNHVDLICAEALGLTVVRVPAYSPNAIAEHTVGLMLSLNRKLHKAYNRVREGNFSLQGLLGFDFVGRTVGVVGTGKIGTVVAQIMKGFGCRVVAHDPHPNEQCRTLGVEYVSLDELFSASHVITLHCPLFPDTHYIINSEAVARMQDGVMLINTSRGGLIDTRAVIQGLKSGKIGYLGIDVYEEESDLFFADRSEQVLDDDVFARLLTFPNVLITGHQAFFTEEAISEIARTTMQNITQFEAGNIVNEVSASQWKSVDD